MSIIIHAGRSKQHAAWMLSVGLYAAGLWLLARSNTGSIVEPLFVLVVLGLLMSGLAWALTGKVMGANSPAAVPPASAAGNGVIAIAYLVMFSLVVLGYGLSAVNAALPDGRAHEAAVLTLKLVTMVLVPLLLLTRGSGRWNRMISPGSPSRRHWRTLLVMGAALLAFQAVFGRGLTNLQTLAPAMSTLVWAVPACFIWQCLEAGLTEEVLFRAFLQQRLSDWLGTPMAAVPLAAIVFGLAHAPGLYLRGASLLEGVTEPTLAWAVGYSITVIAPAGLLFGVLWARTRSLPLVVALHGLTDTLPQLPDFLRHWA